MAATLFPHLASAHSRRSEGHERTIRLYNLHTAERVKTVYWLRGHYLPEALNEINYVLRDYRAHEIKPIDPRLLDLLYAMSRTLHTQRPFYVVSGYRCPATNAMLRRHNKGVAKHSLHIQGKAVDFRLPGRSLASLRRAAVALRGGGVGYYPRSNFIHMDTGKIRYW